ncbi:unnamed protein product, partial [Rotaria sp. Silwood2]
MEIPEIPWQSRQSHGNSGNPMEIPKSNGDPKIPWKSQNPMEIPEIPEIRNPP